MAPDLGPPPDLVDAAPPIADPQDLLHFDLSGVDVPDVDVPGVDLSGIDASGVQLPDVDMPGIDPPDGYLPGIDPPDGYLPGTDPPDGYLPGTDPSGIDPGLELPGIDDSLVEPPDVGTEGIGLTEDEPFQDPPTPSGRGSWTNQDPPIVLQPGNATSDPGWRNDDAPRGGGGRHSGPVGPSSAFGVGAGGGASGGGRGTSAGDSSGRPAASGGPTGQDPPTFGDPSGRRSVGIAHGDPVSDGSDAQYQAGAAAQPTPADTPPFVLADTGEAGASTEGLDASGHDSAAAGTPASGSSDPRNTDTPQVDDSFDDTTDHSGAGAEPSTPGEERGDGYSNAQNPTGDDVIDDTSSTASGAPILVNLSFAIPTDAPDTGTPAGAPPSTQTGSPPADAGTIAGAPPQQADESLPPAGPPQADGTPPGGASSQASPSAGQGVTTEGQPQPTTPPGTPAGPPQADGTPPGGYGPVPEYPNGASEPIPKGPDFLDEARLLWKRLTWHPGTPRMLDISTIFDRSPGRDGFAAGMGAPITPPTDPADRKAFDTGVSLGLGYQLLAQVLSDGALPGPPQPLPDGAAGVTGSERLGAVAEPSLAEFAPIHTAENGGGGEVVTDSRSVAEQVAEDFAEHQVRAETAGDVERDLIENLEGPGEPHLVEENRIGEFDPGADPTWEPDGRVIKPDASKGTWLDDAVPGDGRWKPHNPGEFGIEEHDTIPFKTGVPDLTEFTVETPAGERGVVRTEMLTFDRKQDLKLADEILGERCGMTGKEFAQWRAENRLTYHHYASDEQQLVPQRLHQALNHQGSVAESRGRR